ncbi:tRNA (N6-isopentenyl adenosine(37)-C2)-methylthiotransferase MiaB [Abyssisolibacter fermentans]|uniref:tRNA (N6-isopentenyl adenosine(37)-C2)-methylthiotransferase MiaB n=1 Tax=Abyssisolibacter fermentans TaxID=1766203 RepID=UPI000831EC0F|nr:tRNA (N6-isopentenyl adenosine(37)-C2)-methylthiotransferase MiaB [Abyssisolibacter fermentans]
MSKITKDIPHNEYDKQKVYMDRMKERNEAHYSISGNRKNYMILTYGCQMNEHDSERMAGMLNDIGYEVTHDMNTADLIIFNTCLIRENAELKVYGKLGELKHLKKNNPELIIAVCGCMPQKEEVKEYITKKYRHVDLVFGTHNYYKLPEMLDNLLQTSKRIIDVWEDGGDPIEGMPSERKYSFKAFINIMKGCNNFCSYCIVPYTRGREKSRLPEDILSEVIKLAKQGCKEITLLGQNVNSYGKSLENKISFAQLLYMINEVEGIERIRFMTSHPKDLSDELIDAMKNCDKVVEHLHLPFQSGSSKILKRMNRKYTKEQYLELVKKLKTAIPNIALTTDIIVGFPGETEEDFEDTLDVVKKVRFDSAFTFLYSVRKGTPAAEMKDQIPNDVKHKRFDRLLEIMNPISNEINKNMIGQTHEILVEGISKNDESMLSGRTKTFKLVHFKAPKELIGSLVNVKITKAKTWFLEGEMVNRD